MQIDQVLEVRPLIMGLLTFVSGGSFVGLLNFINTRNQLHATTQEGVITELNKIMESDRKRFAEQIEDERRRCGAELSIKQQRLSLVENQLAIVLSGGGTTTKVTVTA